MRASTGGGSQRIVSLYAGSELGQRSGRIPTDRSKAKPAKKLFANPLPPPTHTHTQNKRIDCMQVLIFSDKSRRMVYDETIGGKILETET